MRYLLLGVVLILSTAAPARADAGLTAAVAAAYFPRTEDVGLHEIAHQRAAELRACRCLDHSGMRPGTAEVLYTSTGYSNPVQAAIVKWTGSPTHNAILSNPSYGRIGCAATSSGDTSWLVCVLAPGPLPAGIGSVATVMVLPDTALTTPNGAVLRSGLVRPV
jgi:cysteine-rich secretory family protein